MRPLLLLAFISIPFSVFAGETVVIFTNRLTGFVGNVIIGVLIAIALVAFIINIARYYVLRSGDEQARETAKWYAIYAIIAFVLIVIMWGIVNLLISGMGLNKGEPLQPDYFDRPRP